MGQQAIPTTASGRVIVLGEEFQLGTKVYANNSKALKHKWAFGRYGIKQISFSNPTQHLEFNLKICVS